MTPVTWTGEFPPTPSRAGAEEHRGRLVAGVDLGSTNLKLSVFDEQGDELVAEQVSTPWRVGPGGTTELAAEDLLSAVSQLFERAGRRLPALTDSTVGAVGVAGMGETGMLIDAEGRSLVAGFAWFDPRGADEAAAFPAEIRNEFPGRTGLPLGAQVTVAKLAHLRGCGHDLARARWLNLPEFLVTAWGGSPAREPSLASRTGLIDQDTGRPWAAMLRALGVTDSFLPPVATAGTPLGRAVNGVPEVFRGALLTVAGHDHLVGAEAGGGLPSGQYHVSMGTAEVLLRVIDAPLGFEARTRLAAHLINEVEHVVPGKRVLVAGVKTGLLLRRVLQLAGVHDRAGRDRLDAAVTALPYEGALAAGAVEVSGARNDDGVLRLSVLGDGVTPAELFGAVLRHSNDEIASLVRAMDRELPPARSAVLTGGWSGMASVQRARSVVLPQMSIAVREQETVYGAAMTAARLLGPIRMEH